MPQVLNLLILLVLREQISCLSRRFKLQWSFQPANNNIDFTIVIGLFSPTSLLYGRYVKEFISCQPLNRPSKARDNENKTLSSLGPGLKPQWSFNRPIMLCELNAWMLCTNNICIPSSITLGLTGKLKIHPQNIGSIPLESMRCCLNLYFHRHLTLYLLNQQ